MQDTGNNFVIVNKKQLDENSKPQLHICLDLSNLSQAIARAPFYYRTRDNIFHKLSQALMLTTVDFNRGYCHSELDVAGSF